MYFSAKVSAILLELVIVTMIGAYAQTVPLPSTQRADRFGIYNWGVDYAAYPPGTSDRLNWAADKVAALGSRTIRVALPGDTYLVNTPGVTELAQIAASPAYDKLFSDPRFQTYLLTAYSASDLQGSWNDGFTLNEYYATRDEFARLGEALLTNPRYAGKTFIILNWEGDNAMDAFANKQTIWDAYAAWIQARADGIRTARQQQPNSSAKIFSGLEFNLVRAKTGTPCGTPVTDRVATNPLQHRCVIDYVAPRVTVDYYSYSAWQTVSGAVWQERDLKTALKQDLQFALNLVRSKKPIVQEQNFLLGEYGFQRSNWGESTVANFVNAAFNAMEAPDAFQISYAIFWQIIDNAPTYLNGDDGFGLYRSRHNQFNLTRAGQAWQKRMAGQVVNNFEQRPLIRISDNKIAATVNATNAVHNPSLFAALTGVNPSNLAAATVADKQILIEAPNPAARFSSSNNAVRLEQGIRQYLLPRDYPMLYFESESQIVAGLPTTLRPGTAMVYVNDRDGVESNAQRIQLICPSCPTIASVEDTGKRLGELHPGSVLTLHGRNFSTANNTIAIEQQDAQGRSQRILLPRDEVWQEAAEHITARLPITLLPNKFAVAIVTNQQGTESNEFVLWITPDCTACAPAIRAAQGILNRADQAENFYAGANITIQGERFSANGNKVIVEQGQRRFILAAGNGWSESHTQINAALPNDLQVGYAVVYIVDAQSRESRAQAIKIGNIQTAREVKER